MTKRKVMMERRNEREERMRRARIMRERMTRMRVKATRELLWEEVQEAQGMVIPVTSSFP